MGIAFMKKALVFKSLLGLIGIACLLVNLNSTPVRAQEVKGRGYIPHLADLMNASMQVHHTKLWLAGHANNWALAEYEVRKIKEAIEEIKETIIDIQTLSPQWRFVPLGEMLKRFDSNLDSLNQAVKAKDTVRFNTSYGEFTATCNACHMSAGQPQIKIIEPVFNGMTFSDQDFTTDSGRQ
jgi:predicted secreted protein